MPENDEAFQTLATLVGELQAQVTALTSTIRCLIETHPDRAAVDRVLGRTIFRLEALGVASPVPDAMQARCFSLLAEMRVIAQRDPEKDAE